MLEDAIARGNRRYLYIYDADSGSYRRDSAGDLMLQGIEGYEEAREKGAKSDKDAWLAEVTTAGNTALAAWREKTRAAYLELLASEGIDEHSDIATALSASIARYQAAAERDFHGLTVRHERRLSHLRLRDTLSARREGESRSAGEVTEKLVSAAQNSLQASTDSLEAAIPETDDVGAVKVNPREWQASFRRQFEAGLEAWGSAEDRFVAQRLKWETEAQKAYRAAEEEWDKAFTQFGEAREAWLERMNTILIAAQTRWGETLKSFSEDVQSEITNLARAQTEEQSARRDEAQTHLAAFKQAAGVLSMAEENITYLSEHRDTLNESINEANERIEELRGPEYSAQALIDQYESNEKSLSQKRNGLAHTVVNFFVRAELSFRIDSVRSQIVTAKLRKQRAIAAAKDEIEALRKKIESRKEDRGVILKELGYWQGSDGAGGIKKQFTEIRDQARNKIIAFAARISGDLESTAGIEQERHRLEELIDMLKDEQSIARAVVRYADDTSSGRDTRAETAENLIAKRDAMRRAQKAYQDAVKELKRLSSEDIAVKQSALNREQQLLARRHGELSDAKQNLQNAIDAHRLQETGVFDRLLEKIDESNAAFLNTGDEKNKEDYRDLLSAYAQASWKGVPAGMIADIKALAEHLENGESAGGFTSTADLNAYKEKLGKIDLLAKRSPANFRTYLINEVEFEPDDPNLTLLAKAYEKVNNAEGKKSYEAARLELKGLLDKLKADADYRILVRESQLALVKGLYAPNGTRITNPTDTVPVILDTSKADELESRMKFEAEKAALKYRMKLLAVQRDVNTALQKAAQAEAAWDAEKTGETGGGKKSSGTLADALKRALDEKNPAEALALKLYLSGETALEPAAIDKIKNAHDYLAKADQRTEASIKTAMAHDTVLQADAHASQFTRGDVNLLDALAVTERSAQAAAAGRLKALNSRYGRAGYTWLEENIRERITNIKGAMAALTQGIDTALKSGTPISPEIFAAAYISLIREGAPDAIIDTIGLYARALSAEGRLTALSARQIAAIDTSNPEGANRARAHRRLASYLSAPSPSVSLNQLAGRDLPKGVKQRHPLSAARYREMLNAAAAAAVKLDEDFRTNGNLAEYRHDSENMRSAREELGKKRGAFMGAESRYRDNLTQRITMSRQREALLAQKARFYDTTITGLQRQVERLKKAAEEQEGKVTEALDEFTDAAGRYRAQSLRTAAAEDTYESARLALRTAEAVDDYARSGSVESAPDPRDALTNADEKLTAARTALGVITRLIDTKQSAPKRDNQYRKLLDAEKNQLQAAQEIALTAESLAKRMSKLQAKIQSARNNIVGLIRERGKYKNDKDWFPDDLDLAQIKADRLHGRSGEFRDYTKYFTGDDAPRKYAADLGSWILGIMEQGGSEFMRQMSAALMYELGMAQNYQKGIADTYTSFGFTNPYQYYLSHTPAELRSYDLSPFQESGALKQHLTPYVIHTTQAKRLIEVSKERAFGFVTKRHTNGAAEVNLYSRAAGMYNAVKGKPEYEFFRLLIATGNHTPLLRQMVNDDVQNHAAGSLSQDGWQYHGSLPSFWYPDERRDIKYAIWALPKTTGGPERDRFLAKNQLTHEMESWRGAVAERKEISETAPSFTSVKAEILKSGAASSAQLDAAINHVLNKGSEGDRQGIVSAVTAVSQRMGMMLRETHRKLGERAGELTVLAGSSQRDYLKTLGLFLEGKAERSELIAAAEARYRAPAYDAADALAARLRNVRDVRVRTTQAELSQLEILVNRALESGMHKDADFRRRLVHGYTMDKEQLERSIDKNKKAVLNLITLARSEWSRSYTRLEGMRIRWRQDTKERYEDSSELWDLRHAQLAASREKWLEESTRAGMAAGSRAVALQWDLEAGALIADAESAIIPSFQSDTPDLSALVKRAAGGSVLTSLIARAEELQNRAGDTQVVVAAYLPTIDTHAAAAKAARSISQGLFDQVTERAAVLTAVRAREQFTRQLDGMEQGIREANRNMDNWLTNQMESAGYTRGGSLWRRQSIVGSTVLGGNEWETHEVAAYRNFVDPGFHSRIDLSNEALRGLSGQAIFTLVEEASEEMSRYQVLIFGRSKEQKSENIKEGKEEKKNEKYVNPATAQEFRAALKEVMEKAETAWKNSAGASRNADTEGLFNFHVGYRPVMDPENPEKVKEAGYGQMGMIMSRFIINEARMGRGHAALMTPAYRKPMWDDDADNDGKSDGIIAAPSLATVIDIAANIVIGAVLPGGVGNVILGAALNLVDDLIFATADVATGYATADQAFGALGRKALTSAVSAGVSIGGSALDGVLGVAGTLGEVASDIGIKGVQMLTTNAANSIIHNGFNGEALLDATFSVNALKGYAVGLVGAGVSSGMETAIVGTVGKDLFNARALGGLAGGLASAGMEYGLTGKTKLNVLNMADLTGGKVHGGLLELNINREGGSLFNVGRGGVGVNMHALQNAAAGFDVYRNAARIHRRGFRGEQAIAMRMLRSLGRNETDRLFGDLMSRRTTLAREARLAARARTDRGEGHDKIITLGRDAYGESRFGLGITLVHEAFRDGKFGDDQAGETERTVLGHVDAAEEVMNGYGKRALGAAQREEVQYIRFMQAMGYDEKISEYVKGKYDSSADYWKLVKGDDGNWGWREDGSLDFDVSALPKDKQESLKKALRQNDIELTEDGRIRRGDMNKKVLNDLANSLYESETTLSSVVKSLSDSIFNIRSSEFRDLRRSNPIDFNKNGNKINQQRNSFVKGTRSFVNLSRIAKSMMSENVTVGKIDALHKALFGAYNSGFLIQNPVNINTEGLVNVGSSEDPLYVPVRLRPGDNDHKVTSYPGWRILCSRPKSGVTYHPGIDIGSVHDSDVVTAADKSSAYLKWTPIYGLSARTPYTREGQKFENALGHLEVNKTIMDYLKAFGTKGVNAAEKGLTNIPAGMVIGQVGNTGYSMGEHLDWRIFPGNNPKRSVNPLENDFYKQYLSSTRATYTAKMLSNLEGKNRGKYGGIPRHSCRSRSSF